MSDAEDDKKAGSAPSWQAKPADTQSPATSTESQDDPETVLAQAKKFLEDESIKDAPTDKKLAFLESKGVKSEDIQSLLGVQRNAEASSTQVRRTVFAVIAL